MTLLKLMPCERASPYTKAVRLLSTEKFIGRVHTKMGLSPTVKSKFSHPPRADCLRVKCCRARTWYDDSLSLKCSIISRTMPGKRPDFRARNPVALFYKKKAAPPRDEYRFVYFPFFTYVGIIHSRTSSHIARAIKCHIQKKKNASARA